MASLGTINITTALAGTEASAISTPVLGLARMQAVSFKAIFTYVASAATECDVFVQTSTDDGVTWDDIKEFHFTTVSAALIAHVSTNYGVTSVTPTAGGMTDNDVQQGYLGDRLRFIVKSAGTYGAGTSVKVTYQAH